MFACVASSCSRSVWRRRQLALEVDHLTQIGRRLEELPHTVDALLGVADAHRQIDELIGHILRLLVRRQDGSELVEAGQHGVELGGRHLHRQCRSTGHGRVVVRVITVIGEVDAVVDVGRETLHRRAPPRRAMIP